MDDYNNQLKQVQDVVSSLPNGIIRSHMQRAIDTGREIVNELSHSRTNNTSTNHNSSSTLSSSSSTLVPSSSSSSSSSNNNHSTDINNNNPQTVAYHILQRLRNFASSVSNAPLSIPLTTVHHTLALAIHVTLLDYFNAICTGATDEVEQRGPTAGFAAPVREIPRNMLVPNGWIGTDNASFFTRYTLRPSSLFSSSSSSSSPTTSQSSTTIILALLAAGPHMIVHARTTTAPKKDTSFEIDSTRFISSSTPVTIRNQTNDHHQDDPHLTMVNAWYRLLSTPERSKEFIDLLKTHLVEPLVPKPTSPSSASFSPSSVYNTNDPLRVDRSGMGTDRSGNTGSLMGIPNPLTGHSRGDFDRDLYPDFTPAIPGNSIGGGNNHHPMMPGNLVGPDHPLFHGPGFGNNTGGNGHGSLIPGGVPPGARFDPFGPPGIVPLPGYPNQPRPPMNPSNHNLLRPNPDHLPPPNFSNDERPPDMYM